MRHRAFFGIMAALLLAAVNVSGPVTASASISSSSSLSDGQRQVLSNIARDTWNFYKKDVDRTRIRDNLTLTVTERFHTEQGQCPTP